MKKYSLIFAAAMLAVGGSAWAVTGNNGGGKGGCDVGQRTNGCGTPGGDNPTPASPPVYNNNNSVTNTNKPEANANAIGIGQGGNGYGGNGYGGAGGQGGQGGHGGNATVAGSGNSSNVNNLGQNQGQNQGQSQGQVAITGPSTSTSGANSSSNSSSSSNSNSNSGGNTMVGGANSNTSNTNVTVEGDKVTYEAQKRDPVSTAYSAPLTTSNGTCMGSTSAGAQGVGFGVSFGSTWTDTSCDLRYDAEALRAAGLHGAARERLCQKPEIAKAMEAAGTPCKSTKTAKATGSDQVAEKAEYTDPIVRARLGLSPLN